MENIEEFARDCFRLAGYGLESGIYEVNQYIEEAIENNLDGTPENNKFKEKYAKLLSDFTVNDLKRAVLKEARSIPKTFIEVAKKRYKAWRLDIKKKSIAIHYPKVTIKNEIGGERTLYDLYIEVSINAAEHARYRTYMISGFRGMLNTDEVNNDYAHSHLNGVRAAYSEFCLGDGALSTLKAQIANKQPFEVTESEAEMFFFFIDALASTESLSGGPHRAMSGITSGSDSNALTMSDVKVKHFIYHLADKKLQGLLPIRPIVTKHKVGWDININDRQLHKKLKEFVTSRSVYKNHKYFTAEPSKAEQLCLYRQAKRTMQQKDCAIRFKNRVIKTKVIRPTLTEQVDEDLLAPGQRDLEYLRNYVKDEKFTVRRKVDTQVTFYD
jgi:hypothetical protein